MSKKKCSHNIRSTFGIGIFLNLGFVSFFLSFCISSKILVCFGRIFSVSLRSQDFFLLFFGNDVPFQVAFSMFQQLLANLRKIRYFKLKFGSLKHLANFKPSIYTDFWRGEVKKRQNGVSNLITWNIHGVNLRPVRLWLCATKQNKEGGRVLSRNATVPRPWK